MRKHIGIVLVLLVIIIGISYFVTRKEVVAPTVVDASQEKANVENYLRANISVLSPVEAVLGGTWYVISIDTDTEKNSGLVTYEDGHIEEKKNFTYTTDDKGEVVTVVIE